MELIIGICILAAIFYRLKFPAIEFAIGSVLLLPIISFPLGANLRPSNVLYTTILICIVGAAAFWRNRCPAQAETNLSSSEQIPPVLIWIASFAFCHYLCMLWPDFYQLGERLRDYALVASAVHSPIYAQEPWMAGTSLNYYFYWYRLGAAFHGLFGYPAWQVYHVLVAFTYSVFITCTFLLLRRVANFSWRTALAGTVIICVGSNIEGVRHFFSGDNNWWGPSRVIPGTINEFPAWSFLLGDAHPHYLNLSLLPFLALLSRSLRLNERPGFEAIAISFVFLTFTSLWFFNANAWEVPVWGILCALFGSLFTLKICCGERSSLLPKYSEATHLKQAKVIVPLLGLLVLSLSLYFSSRNILPGDMPLRLVTPEIGRSAVATMLLHWGMPLFLLAVATILARKDIGWLAVCLLVLIPTLAATHVIYFLVALFILNLIRLRLEFSEHCKHARSTDVLLLEALGLLALFLIIFPEILFFDDSYGGDVERMNTVFKAYSAAWLPLHIFAFWRTSYWLTPWINDFDEVPVTPLLLVVCIISSGFFFKTIHLRKSSSTEVSPIGQGLSEIEKRFPGSSGTIQILAKSKSGVVLEAQGPAYDFTTHIATLSGKPAYLGWANHVNLLSRDYDEVTRRTQMTDQIFRESNCENKRSAARSEGISYIIFGPLERAAYPEASADHFTCMKQLIKQRDYLVFVP